MKMTVEYCKESGFTPDEQRKLRSNQKRLWQVAGDIEASCLAEAKRLTAIMQQRGDILGKGCQVRFKKA